MESICIAYGGNRPLSFHSALEAVWEINNEIWPYLVARSKISQGTQLVPGLLVLEGMSVCVCVCVLWFS